jgi:putative FmdB family regulatory protein
MLPEAMPIYEYRCEQGHTFEVMQRMLDDPVAICQTCEAPVERVFHPVAVHFKGSGFYNTDYGTRKRSRELKEAAEGGKSEDKAAGDKSEGKPASDAKRSDTKSSDSTAGKSGTAGSTSTATKSE